SGCPDPSDVAGRAPGPRVRAPRVLPAWRGPMTLLAAMSGALCLGGLFLAVTSWRPVPVSTHPGIRLDRLSGPEARRVVAAAAGALVALVITRWPIAAIAGALAGWAIVGGTGRHARQERRARTEAIALWAEMLRDTVGTARGVEGVL